MPKKTGRGFPLHLVAMVVGVFAVLGAVFFYTTQSKVSPLLEKQPFVFDPKNNIGTDGVSFNKDEPAFSINPPKNWEKKLISQDDRVSFSAPLEDINEAFKYRATLGVGVVKGRGYTPDDEIKLEREARKVLSALEPIREEEMEPSGEIKLSGEKGYLFEHIYRPKLTDKQKALEKEIGAESARSHVLEYVFVKDGYIYTINGSTIVYGWEKFKDVLRISMDTFKFIK